MSRREDYIFLVKYKSNKIGCIGFRVLDNLIDIYNAILGDIKYSKKGLMSLALKLMCSYVVDEYKMAITLKVLAGNELARKWYRKNGFIEKYSKDNYIFMELILKKLNHTEFKLKQSS